MRSIKRFGLLLGLITACAVSPAAASAAGGFVADEYPATVTGTPEGGMFISTNGTSLQCEGGEPFSTTLSQPSATLAGSPIQQGTCSGSAPAFKTCQLEFHPGSGTVDIGPVGCGPALIYYYECTMEVPAQTGLSASFTNKGSGSSSTVSAAISTSHLKFSTSKSTFGCGAAGSHEATFAAKWELSAKNASESAVGLYSETGALPDGVSLKGANLFEAKYGAPRIAAQAYPAKISATSTGEIRLLEASGFTATCSSLGVSSLPADASSLGFDEYNGCTSSLGTTTIKPNSCKYSVNPLYGEEGHAHYEGIVTVSCAKEGDLFEISASGCTIKLPAQKSFSGAEFEEQGSGISSTVKVNTKSALTFQKSGFGCFVIGGTTGNFNANVTLSGTYIG